MAQRARFKDMIVVLPGIGGSVLRDQDGPVWEPSIGMAGSLLRDRHDVLARLTGDRGKLDDPDHRDGVVATGLISTPVALPGFATLNQYTPLRRALDAAFELRHGDPADAGGAPANYFEFAYDWRRDNRVSALGLKTLIDRELAKWRAYQIGGGPKVVLVCHSMGGLVAKYYLDVLGGWRDCRTFITFGTPFRGSVKAVHMLANGLSLFGIDFTAMSEVLRNFTSVYQLLPRYPMVAQRPGGPVVRVSELTGNVGGLDVARARDAYEDFHRAMDPERSSHQGRRLDELVRMRPIIGHGQSTLQSAVVGETTLSASTELASDEPDVLAFGTGDGTVPELSALPIELSDDGPWWWENGKHSTMHTVPNTLASLVKTLMMGSGGLTDLQGPEQREWEEAARPAEVTLDVRVDEVSPSGEPVTIDCVLNGADVTEPPRLTISRDVPVELSETEEGYRYRVRGLSVGTHELKVDWAGCSVSDVVEVC
ncbi:Lecithin:cholesterol acyltransferase [Lentzea waywayandensis]|uniref:Lecithin:cholesterol acyltransferase n=1 Tax=Lentzea waywayandensis TaxID=84724 RepID=A0A1I6FIU4_9PSEU|nr:Lecithin:cholesterol acyltransferase [Lentzea waywayandensis]